MSYGFNNATLDAYAANLIGAWDMDEISGYRCDYFGNRVLTAVNTPGYAAGINRNAADLEAGSSQYFTNAAEITRNLTKFSASMWIKLESKNISTVLLLEPTDGVNLDGRMAIYIGSDNKLNAGMRDTSTGSWLAGASTSVFTTATWYHILVSYDTVANTIKAWVNGSAWINASVAMGNFYNAAAAGPWSIGAANEAGWTKFFDGLIDEVVLWKDALVLADATALYNSGAGRFFGKMNPGLFLGV